MPPARTIDRRSNAARWLAIGVSAAMLALLGLVVHAPVAQAASCNGASHQLSLTNGRASPDSGTTKTAFTFKVRYTDSAGCVPASVLLVVAGVGQVPMSATGSDWQSGVTFSVSRRFAAGTYAYSFTATSGNGGGTKTVTLTNVSPNDIVVKPPAPKATPRPTPKPTAKPKPKSTDKPKSKRRPKATEAPASRSTATPGATPDPTATEGRPTDEPEETRVPIAVVVPRGLDGPGGSGGGSIALPGGSGGFGSPFGDLPWLASVLLTSLSALGGIVIFAWLAARPRRRTAAAGASPMALPEAPPPTEPALIAIAAAAAPDTPYAELLMPRWRRPSLQAARKASVRDIPEHVPMVFVEPPIDAAATRARVTYRLVRVYDQPDELRGTEVAWLDRGDEVEVVAEQGRYTFVRTPSGAAGWVHRTTIKVIDEDAEARDAIFEGFEADADDPPTWVH